MAVTQGRVLRRVKPAARDGIRQRPLVPGVPGAQGMPLLSGGCPHISPRRSLTRRPLSRVEEGCNDSSRDSMSEVTSLLDALPPGEPSTAAQLLPAVYDDLRRLAAAKLAHE